MVRGGVVIVIGGMGLAVGTGLIVGIGLVVGGGIGITGLVRGRVGVGVMVVIIVVIGGMGLVIGVGMVLLPSLVSGLSRGVVVILAGLPRGLVGIVRARVGLIAIVMWLGCLGLRMVCPHLVTGMVEFLQLLMCLLLQARIIFRNPIRVPDKHQIAISLVHFVQ
jgi:hypothetical protein